MKKFLQKTLALLALCLVSMSTMAQDAEFDYVNVCVSGWTNYTENGVTSMYHNTWSGYGADIYNGGTITFSSSSNIVKIEMDITYLQGSLNIKSGGGSLSLSGNLYTWTGSSTSIEIGGGFDVAIGSARVWLEGGESHNYVYTVNIINAPAEATITYEDTPYANGENINTTKLITLSKLTPSEHTGYYLESLNISSVDAEDHGTITATYQAFAPINKTVYGRMYNVSSVKVGEDFLVECIQTSPTNFEILNFFNTGRSLYVNLANLSTMTMEGGRKSSDTYYLNQDWSATPFNSDAASSVNYNYSSYNSVTNVLTIGYYSYNDNNWSHYRVYFDEEYIAPTPVATFDMSAAGYATLCIGEPFTVPAGYTAYTVGKDVAGVATLVENDEIVLTEITDVPAGTPVILQGAEATDVELFAPASAPAAPAVNFLQGNVISEGYTFNASDMANCYPGDFNVYDEFGACQLYQLAKENAKVGFYRQVDGGATLECGLNKAFLVVPNAVAAASNGRLLFPGQDDVTGINAIATDKAEAIYNLQGQRVNANAAGVYVKNGKKFIVK